MKDDAELLRRYAENRAEDAITELVRRHLNFVYSAALRQVNGDVHLAADVTQIVFTDLTRKAASVARYEVLAGWLFTSTRFTAAKLIRTEQRRRTREQEALAMQDRHHEDTTPPDWDRLSPVLDDALARLGDADRDAVLLRFFEGRPFADIGARLRLSENAARMRVDRALDKLRAGLSQRGLTSSSAALAAALSAHAVTTAPSALATAVTGTALAGGGAAAAVTSFMSMSKLPAAAAGVIALVGGAGYIIQAETQADLRAEIAGLEQQVERIPDLQAERDRLARAAAEVADLRRDDAEFTRLAAEAAALRATFASGSRPAAQVTATPMPEGPILPLSEVDVVPVPRFQTRPIYPFEMCRLGIDGEVVVNFVVDSDGAVRDAKANRSKIKEGDQELSEGDIQANGAVITANMKTELENAALTAVSKWRFRPARKDGAAVNTTMAVPIVFSIAKPDPEAAKKADVEARWF